MDLKSRAKSFVMLVPPVVGMCMFDATRPLLVAGLTYLALSEFNNLCLWPEKNQPGQLCLRTQAVYPWLGLVAPALCMLWGVEAMLVGVAAIPFVLLVDALAAAGSWRPKEATTASDHDKDRKDLESSPTTAAQLNALFLQLSLAIFGYMWILLPLMSPLVLHSMRFPSQNQTTHTYQDGIFTVAFLIFVVVAGENGGLFGSGLLRLSQKYRVGGGFLAKLWSVALTPTFPHLSPKKTHGGYLFQILVSGACANYLRTWFGSGQELANPWVAWIVGIVLGTIGAAGDLFESLVKRSRSCKDAGALFPGWGGLLDRLDGLLFVFPIATVYITYFLSYYEITNRPLL